MFIRFETTARCLTLRFCAGRRLTSPLGRVIKGWYAIQSVSLHVPTYTYL